MEKQYLRFIAYAFIIGFIACQAMPNHSKLILKRDSTTSLFAYFDENGNKVLGDYYAAYTDTITDYGIVADPDFVLIDRKGKHIYTIFPFDNGPDPSSEGIYRIIKDNKIGTLIL